LLVRRWGAPGGGKTQVGVAAFFTLGALVFAALAIAHFFDGAWVQGLIQSLIAVGWVTVAAITLVQLRRTSG
jgi:hypothetical protein